MAKITIIEYTYIFFVNGEIIEQNCFDSDQSALAHARAIEKERGAKCMVARWLEDEENDRQNH